MEKPVSYRPRNFILLPTMACQGRCVYCFGPNQGTLMDEETTGQALEFIFRIAPPEGKIQLTFHGGEPSLAPASWYRSVLPRLREHFGRRLRLAIQTNLLALSDELLELMEEYEISVGTSVDGYAEMCDAQRGEGYHAQNAASRERLRSRGLSSQGICTFTPDYVNRKAIEKAFQSFSEPFALHGSVPGLDSAPTEQNLTAEEMKALFLNAYEVYREHISEGRISTLDSMARGCLEEAGCTCTFFDCIGTFAAIASDGGVYSCQRFCGHKEYCLGNVRNTLTEEMILQSSAFRILRKQQDGTAPACGDCAHYRYCKGGCLYNALTAKEEKDPYCEAYRAVFDRISRDMALEMGQLMLGARIPTPVLAMAGDQRHPYEERMGKLRLLQALERGSRPPAPMIWQSILHPENYLNKLYLHLTFDCPLRCSHCYAEGGERKSRELGAERLTEIIREAFDSRFRSVVITGGEPLVYSEFDALLTLLQGIDRKGSRLILRSSFGFPIPEDRLDRIGRCFDEIVVSLDGDEESHDHRRGAGRYALAVNNLRRAAELGYAPKLALCATLEHSLCEGKEGDAVQRLAAELDIPKVTFRSVLPLGRAGDVRQESYHLCTEEELRPEDFRPRFSCGLGQNLYVEPNGDSFPCYAWCEKEMLLGNLGEISLVELLARGELYACCSHTVDTNEKCRVCEVRYLCGGMCKAWARDRHNPDSGAFDCSERKAYFLRMKEALYGAL